MTFRSTKTYGHDLGLSACFRQWRDDGHCAKLHGYALAFTITFEAKWLDERNWVVDFGSLRKLKERIVDTFDHTTLIAADDPEIDMLHQLAARKIVNLVKVEKIGCEAFAQMVYRMASNHIADTEGLRGRVHVVSVECREHGANSAIYIA